MLILYGTSADDTLGHE